MSQIHRLEMFTKKEQQIFIGIKSVDKPPEVNEIN